MNRRYMLLGLGALLALLAVVGVGVLQSPSAAPEMTGTSTVTEPPVAAINTAAPTNPATLMPPTAAATIVPPPTQPPVTPVPASPIPATVVPLPPVPTASPYQQPIPAQPVANQVVITFNPGTSPEQQQAYLNSIGAVVVQQVGALNTVVVSLPDHAAAQPLPASAAVAASEPDYFVVALEAPVNDLLFDQQWALPVIGAPDAWRQLPDTAPSVAVAVVDSGICAEHPDLAGRVLPGYDFVDMDASPQDAFGHGCGVAGVIAAAGNNGVGIAGVAPNAYILPVRVLNAQGIGTYSAVAAGIVYAADQGARIINLSLGGAQPSSVLQNAVDYAVSKGALVIAAAGNTGGAVLYPAAYAPVIAVASVDPTLQRSSFSSYGPEVDLLAPGRDIITTSADGSYRVVSGTSFAAPQVAGVAALEIGLGRTLTVNGGVAQVAGSGDTVVITPTLTPDMPETETATPEVAPTMPFDSLNLEAAFWAAYNTGRWILPEGQSPVVAFVKEVRSNGVVWVGFMDVVANQLLQIPAIPIPAVFSDQTWVFSFPDDTNYLDTLVSVPPDVIPTSVLGSYFPHDISGQAVQNAGYFPWRGSMKVTQDRQNGTNCSTASHCIGGTDQWAWDFNDSAITHWPIYASRGGQIAWINTSTQSNTGCSSCDWTKANVIVIDFGDGKAAIYMHLAQESPARFKVGDTVSTGQLIGFADHTGRSSGQHLHFAIQEWDSSWNGNSSPSIWYRRSVESLFNNEQTGNPTYPNWYTSSLPTGEIGGRVVNTSGQTVSGAKVWATTGGIATQTNASGSYVLRNMPAGSTTIRASHDQVGSGSTNVTVVANSSRQAPDIVLSANACSLDASGQNCNITCSNYSYNGVVFFENANCGSSKREFNTTGFRNLSDFNDKARSIHVGGGWSVRIYQNNDRGGATRCITGSMWDLNVDNYDNGSRIYNVSNNPPGTISSIEVFNNNSCTTAPPPDNTGSGQMKLHSLANYGGSVLFSSNGGFSNDPAANSYSMTIPSGWSVKTWRADNGPSSGSEMRCWTSSVANLQDHGWQNSIQSVEVFTSNVCDPPQSSDVRLCRTDDGSNCTAFPVGADSNLTDNGLNDQVRSVRVPSGKSLFVFNDENFRNSADCYTADRIPLPTGSPWDIRGQVTSIVILNEGGCPWSKVNSVVLFETNNFSGPKLGIGSYPHWENIPQLNSYFNDKAVSIHIPAGLSVYLWEHDNRTEPRTACLTGDVANLGSMAGKASSIEVFANTTCQPAVPVTPSNFRATSTTETSITLGWNDVANETGYKIYKWSPVNGVWAFNYLASVGANVTSYTDSGLNCGGSYFYQISAYNAGGESGVNGYITVTTNNCTAPAVPSNLRATGITADSITLGWNDVANETGYNIYKWSVVNDVWAFYYLASVGANVTSYTDSGLNCAGVYHYQISAYNNNGESGRTGFISVTTADCTAPPVPSNLRATTITSSSVTLGWNDVANETGYKIYKWGVVNDVWDFYYLASVGANVTSYTNTGLTCASIYHYQISAYNNNGESGRTGHITVTTANCADTTPPEGVMTAPARQSHRAGPTVKVQADAWDNASGVNRVEFYWYSTATNVWSLIGTDSTAPYALDWNISAIPEGFVWVSAIIFDNAGNNSGLLWYDAYWTYFWIDRTPPTSAVNAMAANQTSLAFPVTWSGSDAASGSDYLLYDVQYQENCSGDWYDWVLMDSFTGATFYGDWSQQYCFRSRAYDLAGNVEAWPAVADASTRARADLNPPTGYFTEPLSYNLLNTSLITGQLEAADMESGLSHMIFFVGYDNGLGAAALSWETPPPPVVGEAGSLSAGAQGWNWYQLNTDVDGSDGWHFVWDASDVPDQTASIFFFAYMYDRVGNESWTRVDELTLDRSVPYGSLTLPLRGSYQKGPAVPLRADVIDAFSGVSRVRFFAWSTEPWSGQSWVYLGQDTTSPFELNWSIAALTDGLVFITAEVTDYAGNATWLWGDSEWAWIFVDKTPPVSSVNSLPAMQETNEFVVTWSGLDNYTPDNYLRYDVQYQINCTGNWFDWRSQIEGVQAGLFTGQYGYSYCFRSRAYDAAGNVEAWPGTADATTRVRDPLAAPTGLSPENNARAGRFDPITLSWQPVAGATGYAVKFWNGSGVLLESDWITETSWTVPAQVGGQYQWQVKARDAILESNWSAASGLGVRYAPPQNVTVTSHNNYQVSLAWTPSIDAANITGYTIDFLRNGALSRRYTAAASATTYLASWLDCEAAYTIVVRAYQGSLESDNSGEAAVTLLDCLLLPPTLYSPVYGASLSSPRPWFSWSSYQYATSYEIQIGTTNPPTTPVISVTSNFYYPLSPSLTTTYYWRVRSVRNGRTSDWSAVYPFTITSPASAAPGRNLVTTATPTLSWGQVTWATAYEIEWSTTSAFNWWDAYYRRRSVSSGTLSLTTDSLPDGTYYWRVRAIRADWSAGAWSAVDSFTIDVP